jgi:peptidoglycan/xylan/chitin deacetylase (PgdA/CDA1 family)
MRMVLTIVLTLVASAAIAGDASKSAQKAAAPPPPAAPACANPNALGIGRTVEIDTTGGPGFGFEQYKAYDFLETKEVVLTFDDGPQVNTTKAVLDALANHCTKATFFSIGKMAVGLPEIIREVAKAGMTIGTHTWSHADLRSKKDPKEAVDEIERGISAVRRAVGVPIAPFFRFPFLKDSPEMITHLGSRNIAMFSMDADSFDFKFRDPNKIVSVVMDKLEKKGKGIVLMHDINPYTAKAVPMILDQMKAKGYRIVHLTAKDQAATLAEYDAMIEKDVKGLPAAGAEKATSSIVRTVPTTP